MASGAWPTLPRRKSPTELGSLKPAAAVSRAFRPRLSEVSSRFPAGIRTRMLPPLLEGCPVLHPLAAPGGEGEGGRCEWGAAGEEQWELEPLALDLSPKAAKAGSSRDQIQAAVLARETPTQAPAAGEGGRGKAVPKAMALAKAGSWPGQALPPRASWPRGLGRAPRGRGGIVVAPERRPRGRDRLRPLPVPAPGRRVPDNNEHGEPPRLPGFRVPGISGWELALPVPRGARAEHTARPPGNRADSPHQLAFGSTPPLPRPWDLVPVPTPPTPLVRKPNFVFGPAGSSAGVAVEKLPRRVSAPSLNLPICEQGQQSVKTCGFQGISWPRPTHLRTKGPMLCPRLGVCLVLREGIMNEEAEVRKADLASSLLVFSAQPRT
ncbi:protein transport protein sec31-like [Phacochoerus africanus]|uniref:protein transport protein sec31-like n=1 Tax=Phacochoerus africanus TaxID=41426 RepID=UPI001FD9E087|nr:protein transport protein sec31-like [Phacochoerus africanus]